MKQLKPLFLIALAAIVFSSCKKVIGEGPVISQDRAISSFSAIEVSIDAAVYYTEGSETKLQIQAQQNILDLIDSHTTGSTLHVQYNRNNVSIGGSPVKILITSPQLSHVQISGSGNFYAMNAMHPDNLDISLSGSCNTMIDTLSTNQFSSSISGSGNVTVRNGAANNVDIQISGSGEVDLLGLVAKKAKTQSSGSGTVKVEVTESLEAHISGSGNVYYKGSPVVSASVSGSGSVRKIE